MPEVESSCSSCGCFREWSAIRGEKGRCAVGFVWWSYGRKICLNMYHENSENSYGCSYLLWICFICGTNVSVSRSWIPLEVRCWPLTRCFLIYQQTSADQNTVHLKSGFIWKFSREWLFWAGYANGGLIAKETSIANCEVLDEKHRMITVQGIFVGIIIKASGATLKVTHLLFAFIFCKK